MRASESYSMSIEAARIHAWKITRHPAEKHICSISTLGQQSDREKRHLRRAPQGRVSPTEDWGQSQRSILSS